jgi:hypothetical protein
MLNGGDMVSKESEILDKFKGKKLDLVIIQKYKARAYEERLKLVGIPVVSVNWMKDCLIEGMFIPVGSYSLVKIQAKKRSIFNSFLRVFLGVTNFVERFWDLGQIEKMVEQIDCSDSNFGYLRNTVISLVGFEPDELVLLRRLIAIGDGFCCDGKLYQ